MLDQFDSNTEERLAENITLVRARIAEAADRVGRNPADITLVAVSKTKPLKMIQIAYNLGVVHFGENRVQEAIEKIAAFPVEHIRWHMIGHVQTNKAARVAGKFTYIHSVDSLHVAQALDKALTRLHQETGTIQRQPILLEINVAGETSKEGLHPAEALAIARQITVLKNLEIQGVMTVAPLVVDPEEVRPVFRKLRQIRDQLQQALPDQQWHHLSMGMTDDYSIAIEEGATLVRIGRAIFGTRTKQ